MSSTLPHLASNAYTALTAAVAVIIFITILIVVFQAYIKILNALEGVKGHHDLFRQLLKPPSTARKSHHVTKKTHWRGRQRHRRIPATPKMADEAEGWEECWDTDRFPRFLELPRELRDMVYEFAMETLPTRFIVPADQHLSKLVVYPRTLPDLCFANKQLHQEGLSAWIRRTRFVISFSSLASNPLGRLLTNVDGFKDVRMLTFPRTYPLDTHSFKSFVAKCPGLRDMIIELNGLSLISYDRSDDTRFRTTLKTNREIRTVLGLEPLFNLQVLQRLKIVVSAADYLDRREVGPSQDVVEIIKRVVERGFKKAGKEGRVRVECEAIVPRKARV